MNPGELNKRITFIQVSETSDDYGEPLDQWVEKFSVWSNINPLRGRELYQAKQTHAEITSKITVRYREDITPDMRIIYKAKTLEIISPPLNIEEKNRYLEIMCKEVI